LTAPLLQHFENFGAITEEEEVFSSIQWRALQWRHFVMKGESLCRSDKENSVDGGRG